MENFVKNESKKLAFAFTVGIHLLLFLFLLFTGFIIPKNEKYESDDSKGGLCMAGDEFIEVDAIFPPSSSSEKLITDPNESDFKLEKINSVAKPLNKDVPTDAEYESVLKKWSRNKKTFGQNKNSAGSDLQSVKIGNVEGLNTPIAIKEGFILINRSLVQKPEVILNSTDEGRVVVDIIVNESGKVISAVAGQRGSTTTSKALYEKAISAAYTAKFNPSEQGIKEQRGTYTFVFALE